MRHWAFLGCAFLLLAAVGCGGDAKTDSTKTDGKAAEGKAATPTTNLKDGETAQVKKTELQAGKGPKAQEGDLVLVLYRGTLLDGTEFDSNTGEGKDPFSLTLGAGQVIRGWDQGLVGIQRGSKWRLEIPYPLAYGAEGQPPTIPAKADLIFEVECLYIVRKGEEGVYDKNTIKAGTGREVKKGDTVAFHYVGTLINGKEFDNSYKRKEPLTVRVGAGEVIPGMDDGLVGMRQGGKYELILPPAVAYGMAGQQGAIPPNSVLKFEIEIVSVK